jgi:hypothetical protein
MFKYFLFLTIPRFRFCFTGIDGLFDGSDMTTSETGDLLVRSHVRWTRKLMVAALRAFTCSSGEKSSHLHKPIYRGDRCTSKRGIRHKASQRSPARPLGALVLRGRGNGLRRSPRQRGGQGDVAGRISARSCKHLRKIGDCTAKLVGFQFKERVDQARAMGGKRHIDEGRRFDLFGILCAGWEFVKKIPDVELLAPPRFAPSWPR